MNQFPTQPICPPSTCPHTTYSFRFGEVHLDKAVVGCIEVSLKNELVSLIGDVLLEQRRHEEGHKGKGMERGKKWNEKDKEEEERRMKDMDGRRGQGGD